MDIDGNDLTSPGSLKTMLIRGTGMGGGIGSVLYSERIKEEVAEGSNEQPTTSLREYYLYNAIGSTVALTNDAGEITSTTSYEAFGKEVASSGETDNDRKFCTKERSESIGLDNFGFRYFDWELGRFLTRDPSGYPDGPNNYVYCGNNPICRVDPLGLSFMGDVKFIAEMLNPFNQSADMAKIRSAAMEGAARGARTGGKALVNSTADTIVSTVTMGTVDNIELINVTAQDRESGYDTAYASGRIGTEALAAAGTMGLSKLKALGVGGKVVCNTQKVMTALDVGSGAVSLGEGTADMIENGVTLENAVQTVSGLISVAPVTKVSKIKCFPAGTMVLMASGSLMAIEDIQVGDYVWADKPEDSDEPAVYEVIDTLQNWTKRLIHISVDGGAEFKATGEHPFWTENRGWVNAVDLEVGDILVDKDMNEIKVLSVEEEKVTCDTFNLTVAGVHTFYVVDNGANVLVHNADEEIVLKNPNDLELSHPAKKSTKFSNPKHGTVGDLADKLRAGTVTANDIPPVETAKIKGKEWTANNRRVKAFQEAEVDIRTKPASKEQIKKIKARKPWKKQPCK